MEISDQDRERGKAMGLTRVALMVGVAGTLTPLCMLVFASCLGMLMHACATRLLKALMIMSCDQERDNKKALESFKKSLIRL